MQWTGQARYVAARGGCGGCQVRALGLEWRLVSALELRAPRGPGVSAWGLPASPRHLAGPVLGLSPGSASLQREASPGLGGESHICNCPHRS